ncbi:regulatory protein RecX [Compostibacter hankyongensis]|uniref:Regulatory protein RecX n=1 Tax=Compostibacter hankyongensis TaxID=1007089 RepID=A0ABP8FDB7_9BACT
MYRKSLTPEQALQKMRQYCAYQERAHAEARNRLYTLGMRSADVEEILSRLITEGFLNEERYAKAFAGGKFRMKQWGRRKIRAALQLKQVSPYCIRKAMEEIPEEDYRNTLKRLALQKYAALKGCQYLVRRARTQQYLLQKGYEPDDIRQVMEEILKSI